MGVFSVMTIATNLRISSPTDYGVREIEKCVVEDHVTRKLNLS